MKRLTKKVSGCFRYDLKDHKNVPGEFATYDAFFDYNMAVKRLGEYEDLEEEGRLVVLPCKVGEKFYYNFFGENVRRKTHKGCIPRGGRTSLFCGL